MSVLRSKKAKVILGILLLLFIAIQFIRPDVSYSSERRKLDVPENVEAVLRKACYDCHSNETDLKWFDKVQPAYWLVADHIKEGRKALNFSQWDSLPAGDRKNNLYLSLNQVLFRTMPLDSYLMLHRDARLDSNDIDVFKQYLLSISPSVVSDTSLVNAGDREYQNWINGHKAVIDNTRPALNGIHYVKGFENWKAISTSDRFDNGTMRVIFGNDIAVKAIASGNINPWPDGAILAKAAWKEETDPAGMVRSGQFFQVEFMIKDSREYASTEGWGWARWRGTDLKPYGKTALFTEECTSCHQPMKDNDYVFTMPLHLSAGNPASIPANPLYNSKASLQAADSLPENPLSWKVLTSLVNRKDNSMATLYGNDIAVNYARSHAGKDYPSGAKLALVTWQQQDDQHWFGARIPDRILSVEMVTFTGAGTPQYSNYQGQPLRLTTNPQPDRLATILSYRAAVVPD